MPPRNKSVRDQEKDEEKNIKLDQVRVGGLDVASISADLSTDDIFLRYCTQVLFDG